LTIQEAVHGVPAFENFPGLPTNTSAGFGFTELGYTSGPTDGGTKFLYRHESEKAEAWISPELEEQVRLREEAADRGVITPLVVKGCLKDEKRSKARALAGQARIFWIADKAHVVWCRKILGSIVSAMEHTQNATDISIGINPHSISWRTLWYYLNSFGDEGRPSADDIKNWDMNYQTRFAPVFARYLIKRLHLSIMSWWAKQIYACIISTFQPICLLSDLVFTWDFMPSGAWLTSFMNTVLNSAAHRALWKKVAPPSYKNSFDQFVILRAFGDDKLLVIHCSVLEWWNGLILQQLMLKFFNWVVTAPDKSPVVSPSITWDKVVFLKRGFRRQDGLVFAPLQEKTLHGQVLWSSINKEHSVDVQTQINVHIALNEWFYHGEEAFSREKKLLNRFLFVKNPQWVFTPTYQDLLVKFTIGHVNQ